MSLFLEKGELHMIKIENLTKYYYTSTSVTCALRKINLEFKVGEFIAITGESGSGKTTLLNVISGLDTYEEGEMYYKGKKTSYYSEEDYENLRKNEIAFIFQNYNLIDSFTVFENVMLAFIIDGVETKKAKAKSLELIKLVGLESSKNKKASKLSGGQKQRLAIARALAKDTDCIVADEPTGNLDVENGRAIMALLKKISEHKLVIVVTHNQEEVLPFITRKIRLHDGEIVSDEIITCANGICEEHEKKHNNTFKKSFSLFALNFSSQPKRSILMIFISFIICIACFIFLGTFYQNLDDTNTRNISDEIFVNHDMTRLIVAPTEERKVTNEDYQKAMVKNVIAYEPYDYITDINYYRPTDYREKEIGGYDDKQTNPIITKVTTLTNSTHFMRSGESISTNDLKEGRLPINDLEMVVYSDDVSLIGTKEKVLFSNQIKWGVDAYIEYELTIVGLLKEPSEQAYFSTDICKVLNLTQISFSIDVYYQEYNNNGTSRSKSLKFDRIVMDYSLDDNCVSLPKGKYETIDLLITAGKVKSVDGMITANANFRHVDGLKVTIDEDLFTYITMDHYFGTDSNIIALSKNLFEKFYNLVMEEKQFAVYIDDYSSVNEIMERLAAQGYISISPYQVSATNYDTKKVAQRFITLCVSFIGIIILSLILYALNLTIMKLKKKDYVIFKMIGLERKASNLAVCLEMIAYAMIATLLLIITSFIAKHTITLSYLREFYKYIRFYHYIIIFLLNLMTMLFVSHSFNKMMEKKTKVTYTKED